MSSQAFSPTVNFGAIFRSTTFLGANGYVDLGAKPLQPGLYIYRAESSRGDVSSGTFRVGNMTASLSTGSFTSYDSASGAFSGTVKFDLSSTIGLVAASGSLIDLAKIMTCSPSFNTDMDVMWDVC